MQYDIRMDFLILLGFSAVNNMDCPSVCGLHSSSFYSERKQFVVMIHYVYDA